MRRPPGIALALLAALAGGKALAVEVAVVDSAGKPAARATALCLDPASAEPLLVTGGRVTLASPCNRLRCDSSGFLPGEVDATAESPRCVLKPALTIAAELPAAAAATRVEARLLAAGRPGVVAKVIVPPAGAGAAVSKLNLPAVRPGRYTLELARIADGWSCRADLGPLPAGKQRVVPAWREPAVFPVRVKDVEGKPLAGVPVRAWSPRPAPLQSGGDGVATGAWTCASTLGTEYASDAAGLAKVSVDLAGEVLVVAGDWRHPRGLAYAVADRVPAEPIAMVPAKPVIVKAKVLDDKDRPVVCEVMLDGLSPELKWVTKAVAGSNVKSICDPFGALVLGPLPATALTLDVRPRVGMPLRVAVDAPSPGTTVDLGVLRVKNGESFRVIVQDDGGAPVPGAKVTMRGTSGILLTVEGTTGADGGADLAGLPKNAIVGFEVKAKGFLPLREGGLELDASPHTVKLSPGASIAGTVNDPEGRPIDGAQVEFKSDKGEERNASAKSDARGAFSIDGVEDGNARLTATAAGFAESEPASVEVRDRKSIEGISLQLAPSEAIAGRVVDGTGLPVSGARVRLVYAQRRDDFDRIAPIAEATSGTDGAYQVSPGGATNLWLVATKPGFGPGGTRAPEGSARTETVLTLTDPASLLVHLPRGARTSRNLCVRDGAGLGRSVPTGGATELTFTDLAPGRGAARLYGGTEKDVTLTARETAEVTLDAASAIEGRVTFDGSPSPRTLVKAVEEASHSAMNDRGDSFTDDRGAYRIDGLSGGSYRVAAVGEDGRAETVQDLADGETAHLDLALRAVRLVMQVSEAATAKPAAGITVRAGPAGKQCNSFMGTSSSGDPGELGFDILIGSNGCQSTQTNAQGIARLALPSPGSYDVVVSDESFEPWSQAIALGEGTTTKRVALTRKADRSGDKPHVIANLRTDPPGLSGAVECRAEGNTNSSSPVSGRYDCGSMAPGPGEVTFHVDGYGFGRATFQVPASGELVVDVDVPRGGTVIVPVSQDSTAQPVVVDGSGFAWSDGSGRGRVAASFEELPSAGRAWVFRDLPPGTYVVTVEGTKRSPVVLASGGTATAN